MVACTDLRAGGGTDRDVVRVRYRQAARRGKLKPRSVVASERKRMSGHGAQLEVRAGTGKERTRPDSTGSTGLGEHVQVGEAGVVGCLDLQLRDRGGCSLEVEDTSARVRRRGRRAQTATPRPVSRFRVLFSVLPLFVAQ